MREQNRGTVFEGAAGLAVAIACAVATVALIALQWFLLPDQVAMQFGMNGQVNTWAPKLLPVVLTAVLGLGGAGWLGATRAKMGLMLGAIGVALGVLVLVTNGALF